MRRTLTRISQFFFVFCIVTGVGGTCIAMAAGNGAGQIVLSEETAISIGGVVILVGIAGGWWNLRNSVAENRLVMNLHIEKGDHHTIKELEEHFLVCAVYEAKHQTILESLARIEANQNRHMTVDKS